MVENIGKIQTIVEEADGTGHYITLDPAEMQKAGLKNNDWVKWVLNDDGVITIKKATTDEVVAQL